MNFARYEGVKENADGTFELDIKAQTKAVIEKYALSQDHFKGLSTTLFLQITLPDGPSLHSF